MMVVLPHGFISAGVSYHQGKCGVVSFLSFGVTIKIRVVSPPGFPSAVPRITFKARVVLPPGFPSAVLRVTYEARAVLPPGFPSTVPRITFKARVVLPPGFPSAVLSYLQGKGGVATGVPFCCPESYLQGKGGVATGVPVPYNWK